MRVGIINNLRAGKRDSHVGQVIDFLRTQPDVLHLETDSDLMVPEALARFEEEEIDVLVLNGGDGTVQRALTDLLGGGYPDWRPLLAPIRGGRTNMTAIDLGARRNPVRGLAELLSDLRAGHVEHRIVDRPALRVDRSDGETRYGMFLGAGMLHRAVDLTHRSFPDGRSQGVFGAGLMTGWLAGRTALGNREGVLQPDKMRFARDGAAEAPGEFLLALATTLERLFLRLRPFWGREPRPIHLTTIAAGAPRFGLAVPGLLFGRPPAHATPEAGYRSSNVRGVAIQLDAGLVLDGELFDPVPDRVLRLSARERVRFLRA